MNISISKTPKHNFTKRAEMIEVAEKNPPVKGALWSICKDDILFWINAFCWIYEPREEQYTKLGFDSPNIPFITWGFQDEYILWLQKKIQSGEDALTEKSRDMGASWMVLMVLLHGWLFGDSGNDFLIGSRKEEFVDKHGAMDALFPKLRYQLYRQPLWMRPNGYDRKKHDNYMRLINPENGNYIKGEANNRFFGTGGRYKAVFLDEYAKWMNTDEEAWQSLSDATPCKIPVSSAMGRNNQFYKLRNGEAGYIQKTKIHWRSHPLKDSAWYKSEKKRRSPQDLAAEIDIDYTASISNKAYENFNYDTHVNGCLVVPERPINLMCDFNVDPMCWAIGQDHKGTDFMIDELNEQSTITETVIMKFIQRYSGHKNKTLYLYGDSSGKWRDTRGKSSDYVIITEALKKNGWQVINQVQTANPNIRESLSVVNKRLADWENNGKSWIEISENCKTLIDSLEQTRRKGDGIDKSDNIEHMTDGFRYYLTKKYPIRKRKVSFQQI